MKKGCKSTEYEIYSTTTTKIAENFPNLKNYMKLNSFCTTKEIL
jgi:hypothetical protein